MLIKHVNNANQLFAALGCDDVNGRAVSDVQEQTYRSLGVLELINQARKRHGGVQYGLAQAIDALISKAKATQPYRIDSRMCQQARTARLHHRMQGLAVA